jgi:hypothetical protein
MTYLSSIDVAKEIWYAAREYRMPDDDILNLK